MKVSVLMATYNRGGKKGFDVPLVERAIISFLGQNYINSELIILNDGSTDDTSELLQPYYDNKRIRIFDRKDNLRPPNNWNFLWNIADGDLVCQLHDDDEFTYGSISARVQKFRENPKLEVVYGGIYQNNLSGTDEIYFPGQWPSEERILKEEYINFTTLMYRNEVKNKFTFDPDLRYYFDWLFKIRCLKECNVDYVKDAVMYYTVHQGQETNKCRREKMNESEEILMRKKLSQIYDIG
jgi:glycosyltransferase involved in cell wall biosynthesis